MTSSVSFSYKISAQGQIETNLSSAFSSPVDGVKTACSPFLSRFSLEITQLDIAAIHAGEGI